MTADRGVVDTSVLIASEAGRPLDLDALPDALAISTVSLGELRLGVLSVRDPPSISERLATYTAALAFEPLVIDEAVANRWAELRATLRRVGRRMPVNDSWIAATAMAHDLPIVTQDDDYDVVDGLAVIKV